MANPKYLQRHHNTWILTLKVPADMQEQEGRTTIRKSLRTGDIRSAKATRDIEVGRYREKWARLREAAGASDLKAGAERLRSELIAGTMDREEADLLIRELLDQHLAQFSKRNDQEYPELTEEQEGEIRDALAVVSRPSDTRLRDALRIYLGETKERVTSKTYHEKARVLNWLLKAGRSSRPVASLDRDAARMFVREVIAKLPASAATRRKSFSIVNAFGQWLDDAGMIDNPFTGMGRTLKASTRGVRKDSDRRPWTTEELVKLFTFKGVHPRFWRVWYGCALLLLTGARRDEIINARAERIINDGRGLDVWDAKNQSSLRVIPLHPLAQPLIETLTERSSDGFLLPEYPRGGDDDEKAGKAFYKQFQRVRKLTTGIDTNQGLDVHSFRHTFETVAANHGIDQRIINEITGHANDNGTGQRVYLHGIEFERCYEALRELSFGEEVTKLLVSPPY